MSSPSSKPTVSGTALVVGVAAVFCFTVAAVVAVTIAIPDGGNAGSLVALLLGSMAPTIAAIVGIARINGVEDKVDELGNGVMEAKIRTALADVLAPDHIDPAARAQVANDRIANAAREAAK